MLELGVSLILVIAVLALRLIIQSKILLANNDIQKQRLAKQIEKLPLVVFIPIGCVLVIMGFILPYILPSVFTTIGYNYISVGFTLMALSVMLLVQGESMKKTGTEAISYGHKVGIYANIFFYFAILALAAILIRLLLAWSGLVR